MGTMLDLNCSRDKLAGDHKGRPYVFLGELWTDAGI